ncbi:Hsp70 family protein [Actinoplanes flavus]|uniref:Hsp70 family protein n=1 Tax=Actinoplanes flavus TaxID=2820290 RepID=A0ABS3UF46_9ACTN|nr:Hsp70 family protein [Actinoplanes flavus]MBO3737397.1 Hsp70 family protein [Actinoplanes flavus]
MYALGIDLGTTYTAAATWRDGHAEIVPLGSHSAAIPSVVLLREDETFLTGEAASRRGLTEPHRVAREFKRRMGDTTPILLGGVPQSAEALTARMLRAVADQVIAREGGAPAATCVSYPANWGPYKTDLMRQAVRMADLDGPVAYTTEPEAAAVSYAQQQRIEPGSIVAVYDLGGGTFDAAVLRKTGIGFDILGRPEGIERLGGIDFDAAVFSHVQAALGGKLAELDEDDGAAVAAVARLRAECVHAKEALSADTDTTIPVLLPTIATEVRLTRSEFEAMVRPALYGSVEALKRAIRSAEVTPDQLHSILLVGGSSRMPVVAQLVASEFDRPVAVDAHPKHAVALGAAWLASGEQAQPSRPASGRASAPPPRPAPVPAPPVGSAPVSSAPVSSAPVSVPQVSAPPVTFPAQPTAFLATSPTPPAAPVKARAAAVPSGGFPTVKPRPAPTGRAAVERRRSRRRLTLLIGVGAVTAVLAAAGVAYAQFGLKDRDKELTGAGATTPVSPSVNAGPPADEVCSDAIKSNKRWVCLTSAVVADGKLTIGYDVEWAGSTPDVSGGYHLHVWGGDGTYPADHDMGSHAPEADQGEWYVEDRNPSVLDLDDKRYTRAIADAPKVCARIALAGHGLVKDGDEGYLTGNCVPITRE